MKLRLLTAVVVVLAGSACLQAEGLLPPELPIGQAVDHYVGLTLQESAVAPAAQADDATLLRRLTLDLHGRIPTTHELQQYLSDNSANKRTQLVDRLLGSRAFVRHQTAEFLTLLAGETGPEGARRRRGGTGLGEYLRNAMVENRPWDQIFREIMLADDANPKTQGASEFLQTRIRDLDRLSNDVSTIFFGVNISCAQCHDHPLVQDWKQDHFYGLKSFFARSFDNGGRVAEREYGALRYTPNKGKEKLAPVMFLTGRSIDVPGMKEPTQEEQRKERERFEAAKKANRSAPAPKFSLRARLAQLALEPSERGFFARALVNRMWNRLFGQGLVMPLDQMHSANPPSHPELLDWLARDFATHGYDIRRLIRGLVQSQAYSRSSRWDGPNAPAASLFAVARVRPLTPRQLAVSLRLASTDPASLPGPGTAFEEYLEKLELSSRGLADYFVQPTENFQVGVGEALLFSNNGKLEEELLAKKPGKLVARLEGIADSNTKAELAVQAVLSRHSHPGEKKSLVEYLDQRSSRPDLAGQHLVWALLASSEFRFNH